MKKNKHCEVIKAYADGATIQSKSNRTNNWCDLPHPMFRENMQYRVKPPEASGFATELDQQILALQKNIEEINRLRERIDAWEKKYD